MLYLKTTDTETVQAWLHKAQSEYINLLNENAPTHKIETCKYDIALFEEILIERGVLKPEMVTTFQE